MPTKLYDLDEACSVLDVSRSVLYYAAYRGWLHPHHFVKTRGYYRAADLLRFAKERKHSVHVHRLK